jgi:putative alpha-1,2-mannosidase
VQADRVIDLVDPFFGTGSTEFPPKDGLAASWFFLKAQAGNTHPGACLPFGMVSVCAHSGAYVTGYGTNAVNTNGRPPQLFDELTAIGFTHFHQSGTGAIESYYNYFRVIPLPGPDTPLDTRYRLVDEDASPGYYATSLQECGIRAEMTVSPCGAIHRYTFPSGASPHIAIDFASGGLPLTSRGGLVPSAAMMCLSDDGFEGHIVMEGITIYVCGMLRQKASSSSLFIGGKTYGERSISFSTGDDMPESFGVKLAPDTTLDNTCDLLLAFSLKSAVQAKENLASFRDQSFDEAHLAARARWEDSLGRIQVEGDEPDRRLFYSAFYHSLIKPCHLNGESPFYDNGHPYYTDFSTLWDQYKTVLPLIFTLFPDEGSRMINSLLATADMVGEFSNAILLSRTMTRCAGQARGLTHHVLADARIRHLQNIDWQWALARMLSDLEKERNGDFHTTGIARPFTHTLDLSQAAFCTALIASAEGNRALRDRAWDWASRWRNVYDNETGILGKSRYYEGGAWNYSFRLLHDMAARIDLHGSDSDFVADLERFFGYNALPVQQQVHPADSDCMARGFALNRFEGFNNEPDMETPYAFIYAGRHDRTCEVIRSGMRQQFRAGRGGLPGNNDSGGLTSAYVWNAIGLFPVTGQPYMLIGSPLFAHITLNMPHAQLRIVAEGTSDKACYVGSATLNGKALDRAYLTMKEFLAGGELKLRMQPDRSDWARDNRPPSYQQAEQLSRGDF